MVRSTHAYLFDGEKRNNDQLRRLRQHVEPSWILTTASSSSLALVCHKNKTRTISRYLFVKNAITGNSCMFG